MKKIILLLCLVFTANFFAADSHAGDSPGADPGYRVTKRLKVGGEGGWDYLTVDGAARRLYISRSTHVMVINLDSGKVAGDIPNTPGVHGIALAPELGRGFISNGKSDSSTIFDLKTLRVLGSVRTGGNPDCILYDPASQKVFTFNGRSKDATLFAAASGKLLGTIALGGKPEFAAADGKGRVYVNIEDTNEVVELDSLAGRALRRFSLSPCDEPTGMGLDAERHLVFSGCHSKTMTVLDVATGKVIAQVPIGAKVDANAFDPGTGLAFSSNGDGTLTVAREVSPGFFRAVQTVATQKGARTMALDPKTHAVYLPAAQFTQPKDAARAGSKERPVMVPGSFEVLVVESVKKSR